jgi:predicted transposase YdaD
MEESTTYQAIIEKGAALGEARGRAEEARRLLLRLGQKQFGPPDEAIQAAVQANTEVERLEDLAEQLLDVESWQELLPLPAPRPRGRRKHSR